MIEFVGRDDGQALTIKNRRIIFKIALASVFLSFVLSIITILLGLIDKKIDYIFFLMAWSPNLLILLFYITNNINVNEKFLKDYKSKHKFTISKNKFTKDGKEIKKISKGRIYQYKTFLLIEYNNLFYIVHDNEYKKGNREELLKLLQVTKNNKFLYQPNKEGES